jgi:inner membrane protein YhjD
MVGFAAVGFALSRRPDLLHMIDNHIRAAVSNGLGQQLVDLMNSAIRARASVGIIGLATAAWAGLGWMSHLRTALTEMWWEQPYDFAGVPAQQTVRSAGDPVDVVGDAGDRRPQRAGPHRADAGRPQMA